MSLEQSAARLDVLLTRQDHAREDRTALVAEREAILRAADEDGLTDLSDEQDEKFRGLTREIATVDSEIATTNEEIAYLARMLKVDVQV